MIQLLVTPKKEKPSKQTICAIEGGVIGKSLTGLSLSLSLSSPVSNSTVLSIVAVALRHNLEMQRQN